MSILKRSTAEFIGTFWLVFGGCGSAVLAAGVRYLIASGKAGFDLSAGFASNGYGEHSPGGLSPPIRLHC